MFCKVLRWCDGLIKFQQAYHATTVIRQMQRMALSSGSSGGGGGRSPVAQRSMSTGEPCGNVNGAQDK